MKPVQLFKPASGGIASPQSAVARASGPSPLSGGFAVNKVTPGLNIVTAQSAGFYWIPSDGAIAVGPTDVVQCVNVACQIWDKSSGNVIGGFNPSFLFSTADYTGDLMIFYDSLGGHFIMSSIDESTSNIAWLAASATSDPTGTWYVYTLPTCASSLCSGSGFILGDQLRIGDSNQFITTSSNVFNLTSGAYISGTVQIWNKTEIESGLSAFGDEYDLGPGFASVQPAISLTPTSKQYLITGVNWFSGSATKLEEWTVGGTVLAPTISAKKVALPQPITQPPLGDQPAGAATLQTDDNRITTVMYKGGNIWFTFNDACLPSGDSVTRACAGFGEIKVKPLTVLQQFDIGIKGDDTFYPGLGWGKNGIDAIFGVSSLTTNPSLMITGQATTDPVNTYKTPVTVATGTTSDLSGRWGDYFGGATDPSSPTHVWLEGTFEGSGSSGLAGFFWSTVVAETSE